MIRTGDIKLLVRIISVAITVAAYLLLWMEAHFIQTDPVFRRGKSELIIILASVFDSFNILMLFFLGAALIIWSWS